MQGVVNSQFTPHSKIYLLKSVPIDAMNNTFWGAFNNVDEQFNFFMDNYEHIEFSEFTYQRKDGTVVVNGIYDDLRFYNYLIYHNGEEGNKAKWIYCFIQSIGYLNDNCSSITFETDVIQTWRFEIEKNFMPSYIAYEHRPQLYIDSSIDTKQRPCINTQPEGIEIGTDLTCVSSKPMVVNNNLAYAILGMSCTMDGEDNFTVGTLGVPSPINYYVFPFSKYTGLTSNSIKDIDGNTITIEPLQVTLSKIRSSEKLVGKCVSITIANYLSGLKAVSKSVAQITHDNYRVVNEGGFNYVQFKSSTFTNMENDKQEDAKMLNYALDVNLMQLYGENENTKIYSYPYSYILISDNNGTSCIFKNELWDKFDDINFKFIGTPDGKFNIIPKKYKNNTDYTIQNINSGFESSYTQSLPIISDTTAVLMQSSRNSMNVGLSNIVRSNETNSAIASATGSAMTQQTSLQNALNLSVVSRNADLSSKITSLQNENAINMNGVNTLSGMIQGISNLNITGALGTGITGLTTDLLGTVLQNQTNTKITNVTNNTNLANANATANFANQSTAISNKLRQYATNYQNQTNIQNAMDSYNAKIHDANATADSVVTGSNDILRTFSLDLTTPVLYAYRPTQEYVDKLNNIWNVRGYATNTYDYPNLHSRTTWNYIQTVKCNIKGDGIDPSDLEKIKTVFNNGVTLWHKIDVGNYNQVNSERYAYDLVDKYGNYKEKKVH